MPAKPNAEPFRRSMGKPYQTYCVSQQEISFPHSPAHAPHMCGARKHAPRLRLRVPHISAHPHTHPLKCAARPIYICIKDTKQKNTTRTRVYVRARGPMCGCAEMCGNPEIRTVPTFARAYSCAVAVRRCAGKRFSACTSARGMLSHACKALRTPSPLSQSG